MTVRRSLVLLVALVGAFTPVSVSAITVILGVVALAYLDDGPGTARWLPDDEKRWLIAALERERAELALISGGQSAVMALRSPLVWRFALALFLIVTSGYGFSFFLPQIVKGLSGGSDLAVGLLTAIPFAVAAIIRKSRAD